MGRVFAKHGIFHRQSCAYTHEQKGRVERRHRHIVETGLALLARANLPMRFWHFAFETAVHLINRLPTPVLCHESPYSVVHKSPADYSFLRVFGSLCYLHLRPYNKHKVSYRSSPCVFLGYPVSFRGYRCLDLRTQKFFDCRHVRFDESVFPFAAQLPGSVQRAVSVCQEPKPWGVSSLMPGCAGVAPIQRPVHVCEQPLAASSGQPLVPSSLVESAASTSLLFGSASPVSAPSSAHSSDDFASHDKGSGWCCSSGCCWCS